jgi:prepilin-type N-terminal cleavage/methylation domain-containing protein
MRPRHLITTARRGFTLIELLAVIVIIGILAFFLLPKIPAAFDQAKVTACKSNMRNIYGGITSYYSKYSHPPRESGVRFFAALITDKVWENSETNAKTLTCPSVDAAALPGLLGLEPKEWFADPAIIDGTFSSYAGRDTKQHPMRRWPPENPSTVCLVADDNDGGSNHDTTTVALFADGSATGYEIVVEQKRGHVGMEETTIMVGPESSIVELSELTLD